jgi:hypothetical protein
MLQMRRFVIIPLSKRMSRMSRSLRSLLPLLSQSSAVLATRLLSLFCFCLRVPQQVRAHLLAITLCRVKLFSGLTWDELALVLEEQPWREGSNKGRGGSQVYHLAAVNFCTI